MSDSGSDLDWPSRGSQSWRRLPPQDTATATGTKKHQLGADKLVARLYRGPYDEEGFYNWIDEYPADIVHDKQLEGSAITLRFQKDISEMRDKPLILHSITIHSSQLKKLLQEIFKGYPGFAQELQRGKFIPPFSQFFHRWQALLDQAKSLAATPLGQEVDELCDILRAELGSKPEDFNEMAKQNLVVWNLLDYLYEPGSVVITRSRDVEKAQRIVSTEFQLSGTEPTLRINTEFIDFDGKRYGLQQSFVEVDTFKGSRSITSLPAIPLQREPHWEDLEDKIGARSKRVLELHNAKYMQYNGFIRTKASFGNMKERYIEGRIILDADGYSKFQPSTNDHDEFYAMRNPYGRSKSKRPSIRALQDGITQDSLILLNPCIRGYDFTSRQWAEFEADSICPIIWNHHAFDRLVLSQDRKTLLKALVDRNCSYKAKMDDIIQGKGQGLVILLNGPPGTGKTLTAEAIAEHLQIPIFAATAGDLDLSNVVQLEQDLSKILELSARWGAVLLLDEADAFLEARSEKDLQRNERVAVFLRLLDYYKGVLILTTNCQITFDPAFHSRIHLTLHYDALNKTARAAVWKTFLKSSQLTDGDYEELSKYRLNGRRIKNVVKMAKLLAQSQQADLNMTHLDHVLDVAMQGEWAFAPGENRRSRTSPPFYGSFGGMPPFPGSFGGVPPFSGPFGDVPPFAGPFGGVPPMPRSFGGAPPSPGSLFSS